MLKQQQGTNILKIATVLITIGYG